MAQIIRITSEALQATIRRLLPSQQGFGEDLEASNVITPIIDLTPTAEGSQLPVNMQQASFAGQTFAQQFDSGTTTLVNTAGFWLVEAILHSEGVAGSSLGSAIRMSDGSTTTDLHALKNVNTNPVVVSKTFVAFLDSGHSISLFTDTTDNYVSASCRQVATLDGTLVQPTGFTPQ